MFVWLKVPFDVLSAFVDKTILPDKIVSFTLYNMSPVFFFLYMYIAKDVTAELAPRRFHMLLNIEFFAV